MQLYDKTNNLTLHYKVLHEHLTCSMELGQLFGSANGIPRIQL